MENQEIKACITKAHNLAEQAFNVAVLHIQTALSVETGDFAGMYFSGDESEEIINQLRQYALSEMAQQLRSK